MCTTVSSRHSVTPPHRTIRRLQLAHDACLCLPTPRKAGPKLSRQASSSHTPACGTLSPCGHPSAAHRGPSASTPTQSAPGSSKPRPFAAWQAGKAGTAPNLPPPL